MNSPFVEKANLYRFPPKVFAMHFLKAWHQNLLVLKSIANKYIKFKSLKYCNHCKMSILIAILNIIDPNSAGMYY